MNLGTAKCTNYYIRPAKTQTSLHTNKARQGLQQLAQYEYYSSKKEKKMKKGGHVSFLYSFR